MTISVIDTKTDVSTGSGTTISVNFNALSGSDVVICACGGARSSNISFTITSMVWDDGVGSGMTTAVERSDNLNGFPVGRARISYLAIGNPSGVNGSVTMTLSSPTQGRGLTVYALQGVDQTTPLNDTATQGVITSANNSSGTVDSTITDFVVDCLTLASAVTPSAGGSQIEEGNGATSSPTTYSHGSSYLLPGGSPSQTMTWSWSSSSFVYAVASFTDSGFVPSSGVTVEESTPGEGTGTGPDPNTMTISMGPFTGNNMVMVLAANASNDGGGAVTAATWKGLPMTLIREESATTLGASHNATMWQLAIGDVAAESGDFVFTVTGTNGNTSRKGAGFAISGVNQSTPAFDTAGFRDAGLGGGTSRNDTVNTVDDSVVINILCNSNDGGTPLTFTQGPGEVQVVNGNSGVGNGDGQSCGIAYFEPAGTPNQTMGWSWSGTGARAHVVACIQPASPPAITGTLSSKGVDAIINVTDGTGNISGTTLTVSGTDMLGGSGDTALFYADSSNFVTSNKQQQEIDGVTGTELNWLKPNVGEIGRGPGRFLFVVKNFGTASQEASEGFEVQVEAFVITGSVDFDRSIHVTNGVSNLQSVVSGLPFVPKFAIITAVATTSGDSVQSQSPSTVCFVAGNTTMGDGIGASTSNLKRKQASGTGSLIVPNSSSGGSTDYVTGTPVLTADGLDITFTNNTANVRLYITIMGGDTVEAHVSEIQISDGSLTGVPFAPDLIFGTTSGQTQGSTSDTTFSLRSFGFANATDSCMVSHTHTTSRNCTARSGSFLSQLSGTSHTWEMTNINLTGDGFTWSGSNADNAYVLSVKFTPSRGIFIGQFATSASGSDNMSESLLDFGFEPELMFLATVARVDESISTALGARISIGTCDETLANTSINTKFLGASGTGVAEQYRSDSTLIFAQSSGSGAIAFSGTITSWGQTCVIQYPNKDPASILLHLLAIEKGSSEEIATDQDAAFVSALDHGTEQ